MPMMLQLYLLLPIAIAFLGNNSEPKTFLEKATPDFTNVRPDNNGSDYKVNSIVTEQKKQNMRPDMLIPILDYAIEFYAPVSSSFPKRLINAESTYLSKQLAELAQFENVLRPRSQRWLWRTEELYKNPINDRSNGLTAPQLAVKRVVSESELNSLLKNAWLGR